MKIYHLHRFSKPEFLRQVEENLLLAFLHRFAEFNYKKSPDGKIDYNDLCRKLSSPEAGMKTDIFDALTLVDEMAIDRNFDLLHDAVSNKSYSTVLDDQASVGDLALLLWLNEPHILEQLQTKFSHNVPRSFIYFYGQTLDKEKAFSLTREKKERLTIMLNRIFQQKRRGRTIKIMVFEESDEFCFMLRKGEPMTRDSAISSEGESETVYYRPERFDIAVVRPVISEIRLNICGKAAWMVENYRTQFGEILYGDPEYFYGVAVFTLKPLLEQGRAALSCREISGLASIRMIQCKILMPNENKLTIQGKNAIEVLKKIRKSFLSTGQIVSAKFRVKFSKSRHTRIVTIREGNQAEFKFDDDGRLIELWLALRGFKHEQK
jgi:hypothetical protein